MAIKEIKVSPEFKTQTTKAVFAIIFFFFIYILMLSMAIGLTVLCVFGGLKLISIKISLLTIVLGLGLASLGILVLFFLLKFIFKSHKPDRSHLLEVSKKNEPELFSQIEDIVKKVGTKFPKKIYLSSDVNAAVFYDSSFWSMFLPVEKNLQIGMGLVNTVSKSELIAILSHEFGHFSQKTMKVGSYVYNVNQVIFNLLFENESYDQLIQKWANLSGYFSIFVVIAVKIIDGVKWVLKRMYGLINMSYMGLSREMEFHADEIAAHVTGYNPLQSSLLRMSLADLSFNQVLSFYDNKITTNKKSENLYKNHLFVMHLLAKENNIKIKEGFPAVSFEELNKFNKSKLVVKDQWASHPSIEDRIEMLEKTGLNSNIIDHTPANQLFRNIDKVQKDLTNKIFKQVQYQEQPSDMSFNEFQIEFEKEFLENKFDDIYNGYYDNKDPMEFDLNAVGNNVLKIDLEELYSDQNIDLVYSAIALQNDIETLKLISIKAIDVKTFDYDGEKYDQKDSNNLLRQLESDLAGLHEKVRQNDIKIFQFFHNCERQINQTNSLQFLYEEYFKISSEFGAKYLICEKLSNELQFVNEITPFEQIRSNFQRIEAIEEDLKSGIREILSNNIFQSEISQKIKENFDLYISKNWKYFLNEKYLDSNLEILFNAMNDYTFLLSKSSFLLKKNLLNYQVELTRTTHNLV
ncbi:M48 family metalloprotease [Mongoliibacter ruber]|uniref:Zn-dependent protease with chaperone function n=1 Tax=Mongoliibacter ruber TaxID=1750599 RepID=A0A2T0WTA4_9BACT|nr:M48 family metallopeptidase [Mongoliibacter ruber]PRY89897.1 Zn-dependent protease with chaperone function [Mongoliibacter ruber]